MNIPNFIDTQVVDKEGRLTPVWRQILTQLITELQINVSDEGFKVPAQTTANITALSNTGSNRAIVYNSDTNKFFACENGVFKEIQTV